MLLSKRARLLVLATVLAALTLAVSPAPDPDTVQHRLASRAMIDGWGQQIASRAMIDGWGQQIASRAMIDGWGPQLASRAMIDGWGDRLA